MRIISGTVAETKTPIENPERKSSGIRRSVSLRAPSLTTASSEGRSDSLEMMPISHPPKLLIRRQSSATDWAEEMHGAFGDKVALPAVPFFPMAYPFGKGQVLRAAE
jgi:hypothetical protein